MTTKYKLFILLFISVCSIIGRAQTTPQPSYSLPDIETGATKAYVARDFVKMEPGFRYAATTGNTFNAKIDAGLLFPSTTNTYAKPDGSITPDPTQGGVVGSIPGQFGVSASGGASYSVPIECPAGINGLQPNVALVYNSQGGDGIAGWGWNISGMSMISRVPKTYYYDGEKSGFIWDNTSPFALDGQRLIEIQRWSSSTGLDSIQYDTEARSGNRIVGYNIQSWGPVYFKIFTKSGQLIQYGNSANIASYFALDGDPATTSFSNLSWAIVSIKDNNGNSMNYTYRNESSYVQLLNKTIYRHTALDKITYGGNSIAGTAANQTIQFIYKTRTDFTDGYIDGKENYNNLILDVINVISSGTVLKTYATTYNFYDNKSHLTNVSLSNDKSEHLNPLNFQWSNNNYQYSYDGNVTYETTPLVTTYQAAGYNNNIWRTARIYGDIDGDGDQDAVIKYKLERRYYKSDWDQFWGNVSYDYKYVWAVYRNDGGTYTNIYDEAWVPTGSNTLTTKDDRSFMFLDKDNDGNDELYVGETQSIKSSGTVVDGNYNYECYKYNNNVFSKNTQENFSLGNDIRYCDPNDNLAGQYLNSPPILNILPGDFLGSGSPQFMSLFSPSGYTYPFNISDTNCEVFKNNDFKTGLNAAIYVTDINGNGKSEFTYVDNVSLRVYEFVKRPSDSKMVLTLIYTDANGITNQDKIYPGDFNGDGNTDFLVQKYSTNEWQFYISNGNSLVRVNMNNTLTPYAIVQILDVNKDGKSDILFFDNNTQGQQVFRLLVSNGIGFDEKFSQIYTGQTMTYFNTIGRINNVKYDDVLLLDPFEYKDPIIKISNNVEFDKIINFQDSYQNNTNVGYDIFNSNQVKVFVNGFCYDTNGSNPNVEATKTSISAINYGSWDVVNSVISNAADNSTANTTNYLFGSAIIHKQGKGLLGYLGTTVTDVTNSIVKTSSNKLNSNYYFLYPNSDTTKLKVNNTTTNISIDSVKYSVLPIGKQYALQLTAQYSNNILGDLSTKVEYPGYDNWDNPTSIKTTKGDNVETKTINYIQKGAWCPNKINVTTSVNVVNNESSTRTSNYLYDGKGNLTEESIDPGDENAVVTDYINFDNFGHAQTVNVTANSKTRSSTLTYTTSGRFIANKTNALNEMTSYDWGDEIHGVLNSETYYRGINKTPFKTSYVYDNWGQLSETQYPTGIRKAQVMQWATTGSIPGAKYNSFTQTSGSAPVTVWYDVLGHELANETYGLNNKKVTVFTEYYPDGKKKRVSDPTFNSTADTWAAVYTYDPYGRPATVTTPMGTTTNSYSGRTTSVTTPESTQQKALNTSGQTLTNTVNGKAVTYAYYPSGLTKTSTPDGGQAITMVYDLQGKRIKLIDPDGGTVESKYNGFGEMLWEKQKIHNATDYVTTTNNYDVAGLGLLQSINRNGEITSYTYDPLYTNRVNAIEILGKNKQVFTFDAFDRVTNVQETIGTQVYNTSKVFDALGRVKREIYPSGYYTVNTYDSIGNLMEVKDNINRSIWLAIDENAKGQLLHASKGGKVSTYDFDTRGFPTGISADGVMKAAYSFDAKGNLAYRTDELDPSNIQKEVFHDYDIHNRLTNWDIYKNGVLVKPNSITYDAATSNITAKSDLGPYTLTYGGQQANGFPIGPHALSAISGVPTSFPQAEPNYPTALLNVTYTDFKKIATLSEKNKYYTLMYGVDDQRRMSVYSEGGVTLTRYYLGDYEEEVNSLGKVRKIHYLSGAILIQNDGQPDSLLYTYSDFQGSLIVLTDASGNLLTKTINGAVVEIGRFAYDPWGARRNPTDWTQKDLRTKWITNRGYTGHEHLDAFGIINMNGRVYDPLTAMFFSPDPYVQAPGNWLNYNRYGYCYGNPFRYTDPSGKFIFTALAAIFCPVLLPIAIGADIGWITGGMSKLSQGKNFWDGAWRGAITGSVGGALSMVGGAGMSFGMNLLLGTGEGALTGGLNAALWGKNIANGMLWGAASGAVFTTLTSENLKNLIKGEGFYTNENVFNHMIDDGVGKQQILDYFGFKGTYDPSQSGPSYVDGNTSYFGNTDPTNGNISYGDYAFKSYDDLKGTYYKELSSSNKVLKGIPMSTQNVKGTKVFPEERLGFIEEYKNQGLYPNTTLNLSSQINFYQVQCIDLSLKEEFKFNWFDFIYKIPRRW